MGEYREDGAHDAQRQCAGAPHERKGEIVKRTMATLLVAV